MAKTIRTNYDRSIYTKVPYIVIDLPTNHAKNNSIRALFIEESRRFKLPTRA